MSADDLRTASIPLVQTMLANAAADSDLLSFLDSRRAYIELRVGDPAGVYYSQVQGGFIPYLKDKDMEPCPTLREALSELQTAVESAEDDAKRKRWSVAFDAAREAQPGLGFAEWDRIAKESM